MRLEHADVEVNTNFLWQVVTGSVREVSSNNHSSCLGFFFFFYLVLFVFYTVHSCIFVHLLRGTRALERVPVFWENETNCRSAQVVCS